MSEIITVGYTTAVSVQMFPINMEGHHINNHINVAEDHIINNN